jgi:hypothetical protein
MCYTPRHYWRFLTSLMRNIWSSTTATGVTFRTRARGEVTGPSAARTTASRGRRALRQAAESQQPRSQRTRLRPLFSVHVKLRSQRTKLALYRRLSKIIGRQDRWPFLSPPPGWCTRTVPVWADSRSPAQPLGGIFRIGSKEMHCNFRCTKFRWTGHKQRGFPGYASLANGVRNMASDSATSGRSVCLSAPRDVTRCVEPSLVVHARRATPAAGTP